MSNHCFKKHSCVHSDTKRYKNDKNGISQRKDGFHPNLLHTYVQVPKWKIPECIIATSNYFTGVYA